MKAIQVRRCGSPEALEVVDIPKPAPAPKQALVKIEASGINFIDVYFRTGLYKADLPFIPGMEAAGVVEAVGAEDTEVAPGDRVAYAMARGSYAEFAVVPAAQLVKMADSLDAKTAAAAMLQGMMALFGQSSGPVEPFDPGLLAAKGSLFLTRPTLFQYAATREELLWRAGDVLSWIGSGSLKIRIEKTYRLAEAPQAHRDLEGRKTSGKL